MSFYPNPDATIDSEHFQISSHRNEAVERIDLSDMKKIKFLPIGIADIFPNLMHFWASACSIRKISKENFQNLVKLEWLALPFNQIDEIAENSFDDLSHLEYLELSYNKIKFLNKNWLKNLQSLKSLGLGGNQLTSLEVKIFSNSPELKQLWLSGNKFSSLTADHFCDNRQLEEISLRDCKISQISATTFDCLVNLKHLDMKNNCVDAEYGNRDAKKSFQFHLNEFKNDVAINCN